MLSSEKKFDLTLLIIRVVLGSVIFAHGAQKLLGWFGGFGYEGTMQYFTNVVGLPYVVGLLVILGESLGALALVLGLFGRWMSAGIFIIIMGAMFVDHLKNGFYMNWFGNRAGGEGFEFDLLVFALSLAIVICGSGAFSIDHLIREKTGKKLVLI
ncbi:MAG: DoxX family protein [Bacteroidota bacterium]